jgi:hypothetical protein
MRNAHCKTRNAIAAVCGVVVFAVSGASASALPPDPSNAALVYYRAYLLRPGPDRPWPEALNRFVKGDESLENVKLDLLIRRDKIELIKAATKIPKCDWGVQYSKGMGRDEPHLLMMYQFAWLLRADAQRLAAEGQYHAAFERCLTIRRLGQHVGGETPIDCAVTRGIDERAQASIRRILAIMPSNVEILRWLRGRLSEEPRPILSPDPALKMDLELALQSLRTRPDILTAIREELVEKSGNENTRRQAEILTDDQLVARARAAYTPFLDSSLQVIHSGKSYAETYTRLKNLKEGLQEKYGSDSAARQIINACANEVLNGYNSEVRFTASSNALQGAIEIYIEIARTGQVPFMPPESMPKDPYSGEDFRYETTEDGFLFRCSGPDLAKGTILRPFEFKVRDDGRPGP